MTGDAQATETITTPGDTEQLTPLKEILLDVQMLCPKGSVTTKDMASVEEALSAKRVGGSASREAFLNQESGEIFILINVLTNPKILVQLRKQVEYYTKYRNCEVFDSAVAPITGIIRDQKTKEVIGMAQKYFGIPLTEYKRNMGELTGDETERMRRQINILAEKYQQIIDLTGSPHGDLVHGKFGNLYSVEWDNVRIDPNTGELRLIDYYGKEGFVYYEGEILHPNDPKYEEIKKNEPSYLKEALTQYFRLNHEPREIT